MGGIELLHSDFTSSMSMRGAFDSAKNHKRQRRKHQSVTAKQAKLQTPKFVYVRLGQVRLSYGRLS